MYKFTISKEGQYVVYTAKDTPIPVTVRPPKTGSVLRLGSALSAALGVIMLLFFMFSSGYFTFRKKKVK
jgi:hypothetical protein